MSDLKQQLDDSCFLPKRDRPSFFIASTFFLHKLLLRPADISSSHHEYISLSLIQLVSMSISQIIYNQALAVDVRQVFIDNFNSKRMLLQAFYQKYWIL